MRIKRIRDGWWVIGVYPAVGPYGSRPDAAEALAGLIRFYGAKTLLRSRFSQGDLTMQVQKKALISLLIELGVETAEKWPLARLQKKVGKLAAIHDEDEPLETQTPEGAKLLAEILAATENKEEIEVLDDVAQSAAEDAKSVAAKPEKPAKAPKPEKPAKAPKAPKPEKPAKAQTNGKALRSGGRPALIAAQLTGVPRGLDEIMQAAGLDKKYNAYMGYLVKQGIAVKVADKYSLA